MPKEREYHGMTRTPEYRIWAGMLNRCRNPNHHDYPYYGGRGITVCRRWRSSFLAFYQDMGQRPNGLTLERKRGDRGYSPGNCVWATRRRQSENRRKPPTHASNVWGGYTRFELARAMGMSAESLSMFRWRIGSYDEVVRRYNTDTLWTKRRFKCGQTKPPLVPVLMKAAPL